MHYYTNSDLTDTLFIYGATNGYGATALGYTGDDLLTGSLPVTTRSNVFRQISMLLLSVNVTDALKLNLKLIRTVDLIIIGTYATAVEIVEGLYFTIHNTFTSTAEIL